MKARRFTRRKFLAAVGISALGSAAYGRYIESAWLSVGRHSLTLSGKKLGKEIKILHMSDLHASGVVPLTFINKAIQQGLDLNPDLVFLTGDFITGHFDRFPDYAKTLAQLPARCPTYASLGNHDGGRWSANHGGYENTDLVRNLLKQSSITLLDNRAAEFKADESSVRIVGLGDGWAGDLSPSTAFAEMPVSADTITLALSHNPDTKEDLRSYAWDVLFCGHTHGGQMQIPLVGAPFAPVRDKRFVKGLNPWEGRWIHTTKGVGNLLGIRVNCRPEISLITITRS